jgi:hypothetical protein
MWLCMADCFISAVQDRDDPNGLVVRARNEEHLTRLFPDEQLVTTCEADYVGRLFVTKAEFAAVVSQRITAISYTNFKNSVRDHPLHDLYSDFWGLHRRYQDEGEPDRWRHPPAAATVQASKLMEGSWSGPLFR